MEEKELITFTVVVTVTPTGLGHEISMAGDRGVEFVADIYKDALKDMLASAGKKVMDTLNNQAKDKRHH